MSDYDYFAHGSKWLRADFHLHTKRDKEFNYTGTDREFIASYVAKLKEADICVGVITNHNKFDRDEFKALKKAAIKENIYLMAGVELSVKDGHNGIHTLIVFHEDWFINEDFINTFLTVAFAGQTCYASNNARSNHDLHETISKLDEFSKDYFIIFAHVEEETGLWGALKGGRIKELGKSENFCARTAAFQKVRTRDKRDKVRSWLGDWYPSEVEGSDPKNIDEIGQGNPAFIKIGAFTFEAIQFALNPDATRLSNELVTQQKHSWLRSISFEGKFFSGKKFNLSSEMNCLIGIRGSGKSAILECIRYALELHKPESPEEVDYKYKQGLVRHVLGSGGKIILEMEDAHGKRYEIHRILDERADLYYDGELQPGVKPPINNPLFFGQKELVERGEGSEGDLIERLLGSKLETIRRKIKTQKQHVLDLILNLNKLKDLDSLEQEYLNKKEDASFHLKVYREYGIEAQLKRQVAFDNDVTHAQRLVKVSDEFNRAFESFIDEQESELSSYAMLQSEENHDLIAEINTAFQHVQKSTKLLSITLNESKAVVQKLKAKYLELEQRREALKNEFAAIERNLSDKLQQTGGISFQPDDFIKQNNQLQNAELALEEIKKSKAKKDNLRNELIKELKQLNEMWRQEFKQIETEVNKLNESQPALRIIPQFKGDKSAFLKELQNHLRGSNLRETQIDSITKKHADFIAVYESLDTVCKDLGGKGEVFREYFNEAKASLLTWQVPNSFQIEYHGKNLLDHSLGQRASALILFILSQRDNDVIIIDQPEDDLDNQTIFDDVIKLIQNVKENIQFIFATHNANFPVLGDAEQVIVCAFLGNKDDILIGSIDKPEIQEAIVSIMEGGKYAFARRKEIYKLWKQ